MKKLWMSLSMVLFTGLTQAQAAGALQVNGEAGNLQLFRKVKAVRCVMGQRGSCDAPVYFDLNKPTTVEAGSYIVGFENSIYPDVVTVADGATTTLNLVKLSVPPAARGSRVRVYRDFSSLVEQKKIYLTMFLMNRHFYRLEKDNFGDLYLTGSWDRDFVQRFTYESCSRIDALGEVSPGARGVCAAWNKAKEPMGLRDLYNFAADGTFQEMWVTFPGDVIPSKHPRYLVSAPMSDQDFVAVFPGSYKVQAEGGKVAATVKAENVAQISSAAGNSLNTTRSLISLSDGDCLKARMWKTESRSYCTSDTLEGCDRIRATSCEAMQ